MNIDWMQVLIDLLVTCFGFGLALVGERWTERLRARREANELKKLIKEELEKILEDINKFNENALDVQPLKIQSWESAINTGQVALLDVQVRNKLFHVYNTINEFNAWCSIHTNYYFEKGQQNRLLIKELNRIKKNLLSIGVNKSDSDINGAIEILEKEE